MWIIVLVWVIAIAIGGALWQRFTKAPVAPTLTVPGQSAAPVRRVLPLWLVLVLLILLVAAIWITFHVGNT
jgi:hypothetical protein